MTANVQSIDDKIESLKKRCQELGMRVTTQRVEIFREVASSCEHPDAETVYENVKERLPNISFDTVYRTLASLEDMDMIFRVDSLLPKARFDADRRPHNHFICIKCGEVYDIFPEDGYEVTIPENSKKFGEIKDINLQVRGICNKCRH